MDRKRMEFLRAALEQHKKRGRPMGPMEVDPRDLEALIRFHDAVQGLLLQKAQRRGLVTRAVTR